jgi:hypothetical protein
LDESGTISTNRDKLICRLDKVTFLNDPNIKAYDSDWVQVLVKNAKFRCLRKGKVEMIVWTIAETGNAFKLRVVTKAEFKEGVFCLRIPNTELLFVVTSEAAGFLIKHYCAGHFRMLDILAIGLVSKFKPFNLV